MNRIAVIGFGGQAKAWIPSLLERGWVVEVFVREGGPSFLAAKAAGYSTFPLQALRNTTHTTFAFLMSDLSIPAVYDEFFSGQHRPMHFILAHGFVRWAETLKLAYSGHEVLLLAPKAIGPKLREGAQRSFKEGVPHSLVCAVEAITPAGKMVLNSLCGALGFSEPNRIWTTAQKEALGDLMSEQLLLCGGVFTLLEEAVLAMRGAQIPEALIREECLTELSLIADLLTERGPAETFGVISDAAKAGTTSMRKKLRELPLPLAASAQLESLRDGSFKAEFLSGSWQKDRDQFMKVLQNLGALKK